MSPTRKHFISISMLLLIFVFATVTVTKAAASNQSPSGISEQLKVQSDSSLSERDQIKDTIETYFESRYRGQQLLEAQDFSFLVADDSDAKQWAQQEADKREIEIYLATLYRLNYVEYKYTLDYSEVRIDEKIGQAVIKLRESHEVVFEAIAPEISKLANLEHIITLSKTDEGWVIVRDEYQDELTQLMAGESKEQIMERIRENYEAEAQKDQNRIAVSPAYGMEGRAIESVHSYNRTAAANYADTYWSNYNPAYTAYGNDCTNFVSQAVYEGTSHTMSPVDPSHYMDYWYYDFYTNGGSYPWINVTGIYNFLTTNTGRGPYGSNSYVCYMAKGDVIELYASGQGWFHAVIVTQVINSGYCWDTRNIRVNSHTTDRYHYPLNFYSAYGKRYIHINGWRD